MTLPKIESKEDIEFLEKALQLEHKTSPKKPKKKQPRKPRREVGLKEKADLERLLDKDLLLAEKSRRHLRAFMEQAWHVVEPARPFIGNWHIDAICDHLKALREREIENLLINVPPRSSKSILCSVMLPAWIWTIDPWFRFLYTSYGLKLSHDLALKFRALVDSRWYRSTFFESDFRLTSNTIGRVSNNKSGFRSLVVPRSGTGLGGDMVIADDPNTTADTFSEVSRDTVIAEWDGVMSNRFESPLETRRLVIQQRMHDNDLSGHLLKKGGWTHLRLPMEYVPSKKCQVYINEKLFFEDPRTYEGEPLDKNRYDQAWIDKEKGTNVSGTNPSLDQQQTSFIWSGQYQQNPAPEGGGILKEKWFKASYYRDPPEEMKYKCHKVIQSWDMAFKKAEDASFVVCQIWGKINADMYLLHETRARMSFVDTLRAFYKVNKDFPMCQEKLVEDKANGPAIMSMLKGKIPGIIPYDPGEFSKEARAEAISWVVEAGNVRLPDPELYPWVEPIVFELIRFPVGDANDRVDALTQAISRLAAFTILDGTAAPFGISDRQSQWATKDWRVRGGSGYEYGSPFVKKWSY